MPVPKFQTDTMLSTHIETNPWDNNIFPPSVLLDEDFNEMKFLDLDNFGESILNSFTSENIDFTDILSSPASPKYQIRNHDCMWSGTCVDENHPSKKRRMCHRIAMSSTSTASNIISSQQSQQINDTFVNSNTQQNNHNQRAIVESINNKYTGTKAIMTPTLMKTIAPSSSSSLYVNTRVNTNTAHFRINHINNNNKTTSIDNKDFDSIISPSGLRPDTPLSLGDDLPDFKHIDLTPCPSGNRMKFNDPHSTKMINLLREHLEDSDASLVPQILQNQSKHQDLTEILTELTYLSDYEDAQDNSSNVDMDEEMTDEGIDMRAPYNKSHQQASTSSMRTITHHEFISDHSYTLKQRSKEYYNDLGVCTPSDSDEDEIDVVNMPAKTNLPTNPSARDRRALQSTVAARIARSKQSNHRRRTSDDDSLSSSTSTLSSKGSTPIKIGSQTPQRFIYSNSSNAANSRKRKENTISQKYRYQHNNKKQRLHNKHVRTIDPDEAETIEKRNLHNNMERQRRIGLKNLFEELKRQIPTLKEKERAPKVNILREAAAYCTKLRRDDELHNELTKKNQRLMTKLRNLKASVAAQQQRRNY